MSQMHEARRGKTRRDIVPLIPSNGWLVRERREYIKRRTMPPGHLFIRPPVYPAVMLVPSLLVLLLSVVAFVTLTTPVISAAPATPAIPAPPASAPAAVSVSPAIALENRFREIRNAHKLKTIAASGSGDGDVQALGDVIKGGGDPNVITTRNELLEGHCSPIVVIFARGTTEPGTLCPLPSLSCCNGNFSFSLLQWQLTTGW